VDRLGIGDFRHTAGTTNSLGDPTNQLDQREDLKKIFSSPRVEVPGLFLFCLIISEDFLYVVFHNLFTLSCISSGAHGCTCIKPVGFWRNLTLRSVSENKLQ
jgi:hypothetical protein